MAKKKKKKKKIWWVPDYYFTPPAKLPGEVNNYNYGVFPVMKCPECNLAWEYGLIGKKRTPIHYNDFPLRSLKETICPGCKEDNEAD